MLSLSSFFPFFPYTTLFRSVLVRAVLQVLVLGVGVDRGHQPPLDPDQVIEHLRHRRQAVRRTGGVGDHRLRAVVGPDRKSTRLNSSHLVISYAVFCLKKKKD